MSSQSQAANDAPDSASAENPLSTADVVMLDQGANVSFDPVSPARFVNREAGKCLGINMPGSRQPI